MNSKIKQAIILAGGEGTRLYPLTLQYQKNMVNLNGKFILDYTLETLKKMGIKELVVVLGGPNFQQVMAYLQDGRSHGFDSVAYVYQAQAEGISQAINLCKNLITDDKFLVMLGDNVFESDVNFEDIEKYDAQIVLNKPKDLLRFGVASINKSGIIEKISEKPKYIDNIEFNNFAVVGLYLFNQKFFEYFKQTQKSLRGEYEITSIIEKYLEAGTLGYTIVNKLWVDIGTIEALKFAGNYFYMKENK